MTDERLEAAIQGQEALNEIISRREAALRETRQALLEGANVLAMIHQSTHAKSERSHCPVCDLISRMEALAAADDAGGTTTEPSLGDALVAHLYADGTEGAAE